MGNDLLTDVYNKFLFVGQYGFVRIESNISEIKLKMISRFHDKTFEIFLSVILIDYGHVAGGNTVNT